MRHLRAHALLESQWMESRNVFAGHYLERAAHLRDDPKWFSDALENPQSRVLPLWNLRSLITTGDTARDAPRAASVSLSSLPAELRPERDLILLGEFHGRHFFAYEAPGIEPPAMPAHTSFEELRMVAARLPADEAGLLSYARALVFWRKKNAFCGTCGAATVPAKGGHVVVCTNPACRHEQFPRIDPAIIVLISDGERALLGRQAAWPAGRYSTIAGFVEPGESLEDAVKREVFEETGVVVDGIEYHSSQPWPFPSSLMLGFTAHALTTEIHRRDNELEDAQWFSRDDIAAGRPVIPPSVSISFRLLEHWFDSVGERRLRELQGVSIWPSSS